MENNELWLKKMIRQAEDGDQDMMEKLARMYLAGNEAVSADPAKAFYWYEKLARIGESDAQYNVGLFYARGFGTPRSYAQAAEWMEKADENGDEDAQEEAALYRSMAASEQPAAAGDAQAQATLAHGLMKLGGMNLPGMEHEYTECVAMARKAADQQNGEGLWILGLAYEHGRGVEKDLSEAAKLFQRGADVGHAACQNSLAVMYMNGNPVEKNMELGFALTKKSAEQGNGQAMYNLGRCYQFGHGVEESLEKAVEWYEKSLEVLPNPELEMKLIGFRHLLELEREPAAKEEAMLPPGYEEALAKFTKDFRSEGQTLVKYNGTDQRVAIPFGLKEIGSHAFALNAAVSSVEITPNIAVIGEKAFLGCHGLETVKLPNTLREIHDFAFANCEKIKAIDLPRDLTDIGECAFINCEGIRTIVVPTGVKEIKDCTFQNCSSLEKVVLPDGVTVIGQEAFAECSSLREINTPGSLTDVGTDAFRGCKQLKQIPAVSEKKKEEGNVVNRIEFANFFSVDPVDGLMMAQHRKEKFEEGDIVAELFTTRFGRELELGILGGFANGIDIKVMRLVDLSEEGFAELRGHPVSDLKIVAENPGIYVWSKEVVSELGERGIVYMFVTRHAMLSAGWMLDSMSGAESKFYHDLFATARAIDPSEAGTAARKQERKPKEEKKPKDPSASVRNECERMIADYNEKKSELLRQYQLDLNRLYLESYNADISNMNRIRSRFRRQVNDTGFELCACLRSLSVKAEELVKRGADIPFIRKIIKICRDALEDFMIEVDVDTGGYGNWEIKYTLPDDVKELPRKWENILNSHPDIAAVRLEEAREKETGRVKSQIKEINKQIDSLKRDESNRREKAQKTAQAFENSEAGLEKRIAAAKMPFDREISDAENSRSSIRRQKDGCEQQLQQTQTQLAGTFFLAFGKKKELQATIDSLMRQIDSQKSQLADLEAKIDAAGRKRKDMVEKIMREHEALKKEMEEARIRFDMLPKDLADAQYNLEQAQKRLEQIPNMTMKELNRRPEKKIIASTQHAAREMSPVEQKIMAVLDGTSGMTVTEIMNSDPELSPTKISAQKISEILRKLLTAGHLVREEKNRKAYFRLP